MTTNESTDELLARCCSVHHILNEWFAYVKWEESAARRDTANAVAKGKTPREAMVAAIAASKVPFDPSKRVKPDDSLREMADKVVKQVHSVEEPNSDLF